MQTRGFYTFLISRTGIPGCFFLLALFSLFFTHAHAQLQARPLSPSVVLVLKLVSQDRVQPTTGIVMSNDGLVMVPAEFISTGAEIIVLDGGTDIIKNGRPAVIVDRPASNGWALLQVSGLERSGIILSSNDLSEASALHLTAFPPAEYIANGLPPLWADVKLQAGGAQDAWSVSAATPQPYVSGPILDECGYLVGVALSSGVQSIEAGEVPVTLFAGGLRETLNALLLELPVNNCAITAEKVAGSLQPTEAGKARATSSTGQAADPKLVKPEVYSPLIQRKRLNPFQGAIPRPQPTENRSLWSQVPIWLPLLGLLMLSLIGWKAWFFFRLRRQSATQDDNGQAVDGVLKPLVTESQDSTSRIRSVPGVDEKMPDMNALPPGCDGVLALQVFVDSNTRFNRFYSVDTQQFDLVIGKTDTDIEIQLPGIGSRHVRLVKTGEEITLSDLGSGGATLVNGLPCLAGEILYLENDADIYLGEILLRINILKKDRGST